MSVPAFSDRDLEQRILNAQNDIKSWAERNDLWDDSGVTSNAERVSGEEAVVFILYSSGDIARLLDENLDSPFRAELDQICESHAFWFENNDGYSYYFFPTTAAVGVPGRVFQDLRGARRSLQVYKLR
ncbi:MAG: hypothetical protein ACRC1I_17485 [Pseudomonas proteolytica]|uniref:hypothetical protein n=1 Tax=Pseudomonas proteolytica TaxID=219574 RepID=UPI003F2C4B8B